MKNEKGLTMIELLAAITILFIISSVIYGVLIGANKNYQQISRKTNLEQEANIIISTVKNYHQNNDTYQVSYSVANKTAFIGSTTADTQLGNNNMDVVIKLGYPDYYGFFGEISIDATKPVNLYLKLTNHQGQSYEIDTIIKRY
jgi:prepilin-type N-terminal cleavage/methylation domain-containing protein